MLNKFYTALLALKEEKKPMWGKMTAQHMVEHLIYSVQMSNGKLQLECFNPPEKLPALKRFLLSNKPMPKLFINPVTGDKLLPLQYKSLDEAINQLKNEIDDYKKFFESHPDVSPVNPTFGNLNKDEWDVFHKKHFIHHLTQFGIVK